MQFSLLLLLRELPRFPLLLRPRLPLLLQPLMINKHKVA